jgi:hypothetical protein
MIVVTMIICFADWNKPNSATRAIFRWLGSLGRFPPPNPRLHRLRRHHRRVAILRFPGLGQLWREVVDDQFQIPNPDLSS